MNQRTRNTIWSLIQADPCRSASEQDQLRRMCYAIERKFPTIIPKKDAASVLGRCGKTLDKYIRLGSIRRAMKPGNVRSGFVYLKDVERLASKGVRA